MRKNRKHKYKPEVMDKIQLDIYTDGSHRRQEKR